MMMSTPCTEVGLTYMIDVSKVHQQYYFVTNSNVYVDHSPILRGGE